MNSVAAVAAVVAVVACSAGLIATESKPERQLAVYITSFDGRMTDQTHNAVLAAKRLNGLTIPPGGTLSFNDRVGTWSRDQGYRKAPVSFSGTLVSTWGGGVCQTSTTLYNACLLAGMEVIERHHHQFAANYVPPGRDAAVAFPNIDLKMRNNFDFPVRIKTATSGNKLIVQVMGTGTGPAVTVEERVVQTKPAGRFRLGSGAIGRLRNPGKDGYQVNVFRTIGNRRQLVNSDTYPAMSQVVEFRPRHK